MSVVLRELDGRQYLHVRQKANNIQHQKFINVSRLSPKELALKKYEARKLDENFTDLKPQDSIAKMFSNGDGSLKHIRVCKPNKKNGWCIKLLKNSKEKGRLTKSSSIDVNGIEGAIHTVINTLIKDLGIGKRSVSAMVIKALYREYLSEQYTKLKASH